jgi:hypothetical protein
MTKLDLIIIRTITQTWKNVYHFFTMDIFGFKLNLYATALFLISFAIFELEHNQKVRTQLSIMAEKGYLKYFSIFAIALIVFIIAI